ncbi:MAG: hypothetical protein LVQ95_03345 [Candidatus Micrarchaeales archaeon]|nr:hypothetical protein [Candidatus Micrarchaeales archaeon]
MASATLTLDGSSGFNERPQRKPPEPYRSNWDGTYTNLEGKTVFFLNESVWSVDKKKPTSKSFIGDTGRKRARLRRGERERIASVQLTLEESQCKSCIGILRNLLPYGEYDGKVHFSIGTGQVKDPTCGHILRKERKRNSFGSLGNSYEAVAVKRQEERDGVLDFDLGRLLYMNDESASNHHRRIENALEKMIASLAPQTYRHADTGFGLQSYFRSDLVGLSNLLKRLSERNSADAMVSVLDLSREIREGIAGGGVAFTHSGMVRYMSLLISDGLVEERDDGKAYHLTVGFFRFNELLTKLEKLQSDWDYRFRMRMD